MRTVSVALILLLLAPSVLAMPMDGAAPERTIKACGRVVNAAGLPLADVQVRAGPGSAPDVYAVEILTVPDLDLEGTTDAEGYFELRLGTRNNYRLTLTDNLPPGDPARHGAVHAPTSQLVTAPSSAAFPAACGGERGVPLGTGGRLVLDAPGQAFLALRAVDGALAPDATGVSPPVAGADVRVRFATGAEPAEAARATTGADGVAFVACPAGAPANVILTRAGHVASAHALSCPSAGSVWHNLTMWREFVELTVSVAKAEGGALSGASVGVRAQPASMRALQAPSSACGATTTTNHLFIQGSASPYVCAATTSAAGGATLRLPWLDDAESDAFSIGATATGYLDATMPFAFRESDNAEAGDDMATDALALTLARHTIVATGGPLVDVRGAPIAGATATFPGFPAAVTDAAGMFSVAVSPGAHALALGGAGKQARTCNVVVSATGATTLATGERADCWRLIEQGHGLLVGTLVDLTSGKPLPAGFAVCDAAATNCTTTDATGSFQLEVTTNEQLSTSDARWTYKTSVGSVPAGQVTTRSLDMERPLRTVVFTVMGDGAPVANAPIEIVRTPPVTGTTDTNGQWSTTLRWTTLDGHPAYDSATHTVRAKRHAAAGDHFVEATAAVAVPQATTSMPFTMQLALEELRSTSVKARDAHTGAELSGATITVTAESGASCARTCSGATPATLDLFGGHGYRICITHADYRSPTCTGAGTTHQAGAPVDLALERIGRQVEVLAVDAHTGKPLKGARPEVVPAAGWECNPGGGTGAAGCANTATTKSDGKLVIELPWASAAEMCVRIPAGPATVVYLAGPADQAVDAESARFQAATRCEPIPASGTGALPLPLHALREKVAITGTARDAHGAAVVGATVVPALDIEGFACAPALHHSADAAFTCDGVSAASGGFRLDLPGSTDTARPHAWRVTASAPGHHDDAFSHVAAPREGLALVLWPAAFSAHVEVKLPSGVACTAGPDFLFVSLRDVETTLADGVPALDINAGLHDAPALPQPDGRCVATFAIDSWRRDAPAERPAATGEWPKQGDAFLASVYDAQAGRGATVAILGPRASTATLDLSGSPPALNLGGHAIRGTVKDADAAGGFADAGIAGARVLAVRQGGACASGGSSFEGRSGAGGAFVVNVGCPGTYTLQAQDALGRYTSGAGTAVLVASGDVVAPAAPVLSLARVRATVHVVMYEVSNGAVGNGMADVEVDLTALDTTAANDPAPKRTTTTSRVASFDVPWGAFSLVAQAPAGHAPSRYVLPLEVEPGEQRYVQLYAARSP